MKKIDIYACTTTVKSIQISIITNRPKHYNIDLEQCFYMTKF